MEVKENTRLHLLDAFRGFLLLHMIAYHGMWNLVNLFGVEARWYTGSAGYLWQQFICWSFILLSGFCWSMSRSHVRRGLLVFGGGVVDCVLAFLVAFLGQGLAFAMDKAGMRSFVSTLVGSFLGTILPMLFHLAAGGLTVDATVAACLMPMLPGLAMTNALQDTLRGDMVSGISSATSAVLTASMIAGGAVVGATVFRILTGGGVL